ncbi:MAG: hypothetical protein WD883_01930 [Candidatus Colwellbacteria bacterium]
MMELDKTKDALSLGEKASRCKLLRGPVNGYSRSIVIRNRWGKILYDNLARVIACRDSQAATAIAIADRNGVFDDDAIKVIADGALTRILSPDDIVGFEYDPALLGRAMCKAIASH